MASALHRHVAQAVRERMDLDAIEETIIGPAAIEEDQKAALWLYAHTLSERPRILREPVSPTRLTISEG